MRPPVAPTGWPSEMPEPLGLSRSSVGVDLPLAQAGEHLGGERLVELDQVDLVEGEPGAVEGRGGRGDRADAHHLGADAGDGPRLQGEQRAQPAALGLLAGGHDAHRGAVVLAAGVAGGDGGLGVDLLAHRPQRGQLLEGGLGAGVLVAVDDDVGLAAAARDGDRHELVGEPAGLVGGAGPLLGADRELVLLLARDVVLAAQVLGRLEHAAGDRVVLAAGGLAGADQAVHQLDASRRWTPVRRPRA